MNSALKLGMTTNVVYEADADQRFTTYCLALGSVSVEFVSHIPRRLERRGRARKGRSKRGIGFQKPERAESGAGGEDTGH